MAKKVSFFMLLILCVSMLIGCGKVIDLTDEETRLIAEYAATSLLKYDLNYTDRIAEGDREALEKSETEHLKTEQITENSEELTEEVTTGESSFKDKEDSEKTSEEAEVETVTDLADLFGVDGLSVAYKDYLIAKQYPAKNKEGELIYLNASEGYELLVVQFQLKNTIEEPVEASFLDKEIDYKLLCNGNKAAKPMLTILLDDLTTLEVVLDPSEESEAVLVFQIAEDMKEKLQTIELNVHYNDTDSKIYILR